MPLFISAILLLFSACSTKYSGSAGVKSALTYQYFQYEGVPYKWGGNDKGGLDCSGLVKITYQELFGLNLPRTTRKLIHEGLRVSASYLIAGDLVFFKTKPNTNHVGIYMGDGTFMHVSSSKGVMKSRLDNPYWQKHYWQSRRYLK